jgi:hypothetical protein
MFGLWASGAYFYANPKGGGYGFVFSQVSTTPATKTCPAPQTRTCLWGPLTPFPTNEDLFVGAPVAGDPGENRDPSALLRTGSGAPGLDHFARRSLLAALLVHPTNHRASPITARLFLFCLALGTRSIKE